MRARLLFWSKLFSAGLILAILASMLFHWMHPEAALVRMGRQAMTGERYAEAAEYFEAAGRRTKDPTRFQGSELRARMQANDWIGARNNLEHLLAQERENLGLRRQLAGLLQALGEPSEAIAHWEFILVRKPGDADALYQRAAATLQSGQMELAEQRFLELLEVRADHAGGRLALGKLLAWRGELEAAEQVFRELLDHFPGWFEARVYLARVLSWQGDWESSAEAYRMALKQFS